MTPPVSSHFARHVQEGEMAGPARAGLFVYAGDPEVNVFQVREFMR